MPKFSVGDDVLSEYQGQHYPARCLAVDTSAGRDTLFYVHYLGWSKRWDTWVSDRNLKKATQDEIASAKKKPVPTEKAKKKKLAETPKSFLSGKRAREDSGKRESKRKSRKTAASADEDEVEDFQFDVVVGAAEGDAMLPAETVYMDEMPILGGEEVIAEGGATDDDMFDLELLQPMKKEKKKKEKKPKKERMKVQKAVKPVPAATSPKRRGMSGSSAAFASDSELSEPEVMVKKARGRPRKDGQSPRQSAPAGRKRSAATLLSDSEQESPSLKRRGGPGRPSVPKRQKPVAMAMPTPTTAPKSKRGRPSKTVKEPETTQTIDDEAFSAAQELIRLGEVEASEALPSFAGTSGDVEVTGLVTDFDTFDQMEVLPQPSPPKIFARTRGATAAQYEMPGTSQRATKKRTPKKPATPKKKTPEQPKRSPARRAAAPLPGRGELNRAWAVELPEQLTTKNNKPRLLNSYSLWFKYESRNWNIGDKEALSSAMRQIGHKWRNEVSPEEKEIWRQRARIYNAKLSQDLGLASAPLDIQALASAQSLAGLGYGLGIDSLPPAKRRELMKKKQLDPISNKLQWDYYCQKPRKSQTHPEPWTLEIGEAAGIFRVVGAAMDDVAYKLRNSKVRGRKVFEESSQMSRDMALQLLLDTLLSTCGTLMTLTKHVDCLDGASSRDLRQITENSAAYLPVLYTSG